MKLDELDTQRWAEIQGLVVHPGWKVVTEVLTERMAKLQRAIMITESLRPDGLSDERIRGEYFVILKFLQNPVDLMQMYASLSAEPNLVDRSKWEQDTEQFGMTRAGIPAEPTSDEGNTE